MSEVKVGKLDYSHPRTIWTLGIQLMYTIIAMIPLYYYMIEILTIRSEARDFVIYSPIFVAIILFFLQLKLNSYFWTSEKTFVKRDITITSSKSAFTIVLEFYLIFLFIFGYFLAETDTYQRVQFQTELSQLMFEIFSTLILIYFTVIMMLNVQSTRFEQVFNRSVSKIRRRK